MRQRMRSVCVAYALREQRLQVMAEVMLLNVARWLKTQRMRSVCVERTTSAGDGRGDAAERSALAQDAPAAQSRRLQRGQ
jgi:hypothetical protein